MVKVNVWEILQGETKEVTVDAGQELVLATIESGAGSHWWKQTGNTCGAKLQHLEDMWGAPKRLRRYTGQKYMIYDTLGPDANFTRGVPCDLTLALIKEGRRFPDSE